MFTHFGSGRNCFTKVLTSLVCVCVCVCLIGLNLFVCVCVCSVTDLATDEQDRGSTSALTLLMVFIGCARP